MRDKRWFAQFVFAGFLKYFDLQFARPVTFLDADIEFFADTNEVVPIADFGRVDVRIETQDNFLNGHPGECFAEIKFFALVGQTRYAQYCLRHAMHQRFDHVDQVFIIRIGAIQLEHRKLGVVLC